MTGSGNSAGGSARELDAFLDRRVGGGPLKLPLVDHPPGLRLGLTEFLVEPGESVTSAALDAAAALARDVFLTSCGADDQVWAVAQHSAAVQLHLPDAALRPDGTVDLTASDSPRLVDDVLTEEQWSLLLAVLGLPDLPRGAIRRGEDLYGTVADQLPPGHVLEEPDEHLPYVEVRARVAVEDVASRGLFDHLVRKDFPGLGPSLSWDVHLADVRRGLVLTVYDDRGLVVIGEQAELDALRERYASFVMDVYDE